MVRDPAKVAWLSQTTLSVDETLETVAAIRERFPALLDPPSDDICYATQNRQLAVKEIARDADLVIVVGSGNSSNSVRLVEVALEAGATVVVPRRRRLRDRRGLARRRPTRSASPPARACPRSWCEGVLAFLAERGYPDAQAVHTAEESLIFALPKELRRDLKAAPAPRGPSARHGAATSTCTPTTRSRGWSRQVVEALRDDALIAYPTDSGYALGCQLGNRDGRDRILRIRELDERHHFTLMCKDFAQLGQFVHVDNSAFRAIKAATPGPVHVHPAGDRRGAAPADAPQEAHRRRADPRPRRRARAARGARRAAADQHADPARRGRAADLGWEIKEELDHQVDIVVEAGETIAEPTTVVDWSEGYPEIVRVGAGDPDALRAA